MPVRLLTSRSLRVAAPMRRERNRKRRACSGPSWASCAYAKAEKMRRNRLREFCTLIDSF